jgi:hypothetical protein
VIHGACPEQDWFCEDLFRRNLVVWAEWGDGTPAGETLLSWYPEFEGLVTTGADLAALGAGEDGMPSLVPLNLGTTAYGLRPAVLWLGEPEGEGDGDGSLEAVLLEAIQDLYRYQAVLLATPPEGGWDEESVLSALRLVAQRAPELGVDPDRLAVAGIGASPIMAAAVAVGPNSSGGSAGQESELIDLAIPDTIVAVALDPESLPETDPEAAVGTDTGVPAVEGDDARRAVLWLGGGDVVDQDLEALLVEGIESLSPTQVVLLATPPEGGWSVDAVLEELRLVAEQGPELGVDLDLLTVAGMGGSAIVAAGIAAIPQMSDGNPDESTGLIDPVIPATIVAMVLDPPAIPTTLLDGLPMPSGEPVAPGPDFTVITSTDPDTIFGAVFDPFERRGIAHRIDPEFLFLDPTLDLPPHATGTLVDVLSQPLGSGDDDPGALEGGTDASNEGPPPGPAMEGATVPRITVIATEAREAVTEAVLGPLEARGLSAEPEFRLLEPDPDLVTHTAGIVVDTLTRPAALRTVTTDDLTALANLMGDVGEGLVPEVTELADWELDLLDFLAAFRIGFAPASPFPTSVVVPFERTPDTCKVTGENDMACDLTIGNEALVDTAAGDAVRVTHRLGGPLLGLGDALALTADVLAPVAYEDDPDAYQAVCSPRISSGEVAIWQARGWLIVALTPGCGEHVAGYLGDAD